MTVIRFMGSKTVFTIVLISAAVLGFDLIVDNYLLFHVIAEFFAICILVTLFTITWNAKEFLQNSYLIFIGIGGLFIGILDLLHTLTYTGMNIIRSPIYYANQFWVATRLFESLMILLGFVFVSRKIPINRNWLLAVYAAITIAIILSILVFEIFPVSYIENVGQTPFKIYSEFVIILLLLTSILVLLKNKNYFEKDIRQLLFWSILFAVISEFCFTLYVENYDFINKMGHIFKIVSFFLIFKANVQSGFTRPMETFFRDLKISEEKIKESNRELQKEISTKNRFFSILAHDLRNPFTVLLGFSDFLLENYSKVDEADRKKMIKNIYETSEQTHKLLENLLSWSLTQSKNIVFNPTEFDIKDLLDESHDLIIKQAQLKNITVTREYASAFVSADADMIKTILRNLLSNAVKFTPRGGRVSMKSSVINGNLKITISDTGVGIPADKIQSLFLVDENQSTKGTENESGIGLGLIICNEFIRMHQSELTIESEPQRGSSFSFYLPQA